MIDEEVKRIVNEANEAARKILEENMDGLHKLAKSLLEYETLTGDEIKLILDGKELNREEDSDIEQSKGSTISSVPSSNKKGPKTGGFKPSPQPNS